MKCYRFLAPLVVVLGLVAFEFVPAAQGVQEVDLDHGGAAYEVNRDTLGKLYVSDAGAHKIWQINPANNIYTIYPIGYEVRDAQSASEGRIWWVDNADTFGYVSSGSPLSTHWTLTFDPPYHLQALAPDDQGGVWLGEGEAGGEMMNESRLFHFSPSDNRLCTYSLPYDAYTHDMVFDEGYLWLGQWVKGQIYRISPGAGYISYTYWQEVYTEEYGPWGIAVDGKYVWWADYFHGAIARLDPSTNVTTFYPLPMGGSPRVITLNHGKIWYSEENASKMSALNPAAAPSYDLELAVYSESARGECTSLGAGTTNYIFINSNQLLWRDGDTNLAYDQYGWQIYELPGEAKPYGVAGSGGSVWVTDQGRFLLLRFNALASTYLPVIKEK